jgi:hypothetical protein
VVKVEITVDGFPFIAVFFYLCHPFIYLGPTRAPGHSRTLVFDQLAWASDKGHEQYMQQVKKVATGAMKTLQALANAGCIVAVSAAMERVVEDFAELLAEAHAPSTGVQEKQEEACGDSLVLGNNLSADNVDTVLTKRRTRRRILWVAFVLLPWPCTPSLAFLNALACFGMDVLAI